jgi:ATP adenylyltransferase
VRAERCWQAGLAVAEQALRSGSLVPLDTQLIEDPALQPFRLRQLLSATPRHLRASGPRPNPFLPWDKPLEVERVGCSHVVLLNKYPVQTGHLLLITQQWQPQTGWLAADDWRAVAWLAADTDGLWFFNSSAMAGASQPHRHLQLLPRAAGELSCPLSPLLQAQLAGRSEPWPWAYRLSPRRDPLGGSDLPLLYAEHAHALDLGDPGRDPHPRHPYNLLFNDDWFMTVRRTREHCAGFSLNALGFAGYLLSTDGSDRDWLDRYGPWELLQAVAAPGQGMVINA